MKELLRELVSLPGTCGFEEDVAQYLYRRVAPLADEAYVDGVGNLIVMKQGGLEGPTLMLSAHMDEVGFMVRKIEKNGLLRFEKLGGHDDRVLPSEHVLVHGAKGACHGIIGTISCHMRRFDDEKLVRHYRQLYIDVGARDDAGVGEMGISEGDSITWATPLQDFGQNRALGHGFDDRAGCALLVKALEETDFSQVHGKVYFVFSSQEEVGLRGARVASQQIAADVALAVDTTPASDTPESVNDGTILLGGGPGIKAMDGSLVANAKVRRRLQELCAKLDIPCQIEVFPGIGTDAGEMHKEKAGVPTGAISIPSRYAHCPHEVIDWGDMDQCLKLLQAFILSLREPGEFWSL